MNIIFVLEQLNTGGIATTYMRWADELIKHNYNVTIICQKNAGIYLNQVPSHATLHVLNKKRAIFSCFGLRKLLKHYAEEKGETVVISGAYTSIYVNICRPKALKHWIMIPSPPRTNFTIGRAHSPRMQLTPYIYHYFYKRAIRNSQFVTGVSTGVSRETEDWCNLPHNSIKTLFNPAYTPYTLSTSKPPHPWLADNTLTTCVACGRLAASKNYPFLLNAFHQAYMQNTQLRLLILGEGKLKEQLSTFIAHTFQQPYPIELVGNVSTPRDYMYHADKFISSAQVEGFGNAIVEALSTGTSIIATDAPYGPKEILANGTYGQIIPLNDADSLTRAILSKKNLSTTKDRIARAEEFSAAHLLPHFIEYLKAL